MSDTQSDLWCRRAEYGPYILRGRQRWVMLAGELRDDPAYRLVFVEDGVHIVRPKHSPQDLQFSSGMSYLVAPQALHHWDSAPGTRAIMCAFLVTTCPLKSNHSQSRARVPVDPSCLQPAPREVWGVDLPLKTADELASRIESDLRSIVATWWRSDWQQFQANNRLANLLLHMVSHQRHVVDEGSDAIDVDDHRPVIKAMQIIDSTLSSLSNSAEVAHALGYSPDHLARLFKSRTGETTAAYLRRRRLDEAADLVRTTTLPISVIAQRVGYRGPVALQQAWKTRFDVPPLQWRKRQP